MFQIGKTIVSEDLIEKDFVCNLGACKGECCIAGEAGAPLDIEEVAILSAIYKDVKPFLRPEGIAAIEKQGTSIVSDFDELETTLVDGAECAYVTFTDKGIASCGIEDAFNAGKSHFRKPISCHLYPVRVQEYSEFSAVNYHKWDICDDACVLGKELQVPVYKFVKDALIRKFGEDWYKELETVSMTFKK
ncbi:MAG: hypothetical protein AUK33_06480 [Flavobacteriaceae bacterium CG2_30_34_30]|nr:MAG: hypothetical protein AUK33_06480 [Flavobacteriaceae bacterium CG2_30_34_30]PIQ19375.1 MAG: hypothetical protein COW66_01360 [Flavobacteriaceae bacterium CG18_big_fil_WC_8_21_14_2_50_34_36]PIV49909.1 MAG: DUF3109 domain-containing protein [Flavobacteriaceae bacterium CG02_land_8_20_14_3_00_34_13]PIZ08022.1 MAG: DUF3109 domain-containing protein [Flavobacteriaceae bacterium CG_4_10_14_0_8_um_filter_34_31]PJC06006.1 MAG: DUF3109 domain-containing protein [Flavobacteriaceae bacterium CG_4_9